MKFKLNVTKQKTDQIDFPIKIVNKPQNHGKFEGEHDCQNVQLIFN